VREFAVRKCWSTLFLQFRTMFLEACPMRINPNRARAYRGDDTIAGARALPMTMAQSGPLLRSGAWWLAALAAATMMCSHGAHADGAPAPAGIVRMPIPDPHFPIAASVSVPAGFDTVYISGQLPDMADSKASPGTVEAYGDTETQTRSVLKKLGAALEAQGLGFGDVVSARVYLVGDPRKNGDIDFSGMNAAFSQYFGSAAQPNKPARAAVKVAALVVPGTLVEIEFIAARAPQKASAAAKK
jgi:enamine deaminase RidA (YjgF/YER057c/UK114 family)